MHLCIHVQVGSVRKIALTDYLVINFNLGWILIARCKTYTVQFRRKLGDGERAVLLAAGSGDITIGFRRILEAYRHLHGIGFRPSDPVQIIGLRNVDDGGVNE